MDIQYFKSAWGDIKNSRGWFGKLCLLALLNFIPVFGQIVSFAYIYGWAREIAWGTHEPMPRKIFNNDDGKFWRRGWFVFLLAFVFSLIPGIVYSIGATLESTQVVMTFFGPRITVDPVLNAVGAILRVVGLAGMVLMSILAWVGGMRVAIYDRLSAGFQFGKIWKMIRHDSSGILRIFGMQVLFMFLLGIILAIVFFILLMFVVMAGVAGLVNAGYTLDSLQYLTQAQAAQVLLRFFASAGGIGILSLLVGGFMSGVIGLFVQLLVVRAVGYWTMQFEVPIWGGQDDPMPFELVNEPEPVSAAFSGAMPSQSQQPVSAAPAPAPEPVSAPAPAPASAPASAPAALAPQGVSDAVLHEGQAPVPTSASMQDSHTRDTQSAMQAPVVGFSPEAPTVPVAPIPMPPVSDAFPSSAGFEAPEMPAGDESAQPNSPAFASGASAEAREAAQSSPVVTYEGPMVVGAEFVMSPEEIDHMKSAQREQGDEGR